MAKSLFLVLGRISRRKTVGTYELFVEAPFSGSFCQWEYELVRLK